MKISTLKTFIAFALAAMAATVDASNTLTIYSYDSFASEWGPGPKLKTQFEQQCQCQVNIVALDDALAMLGRLKLEGKDSPADVVIGLDLNTLAIAENTDLFTDHQISLDALTLPIEWDSNVFVPFDYGYFAFIYNSDLIQAPPSSLQELVANPKAYKYVIQDPRSSTPGLGLLLWIKQVYGDQAAEIWQQLAPSILTVTSGWSEAYGLFLEAEADMVLSYTTSPAYHLIAESEDKFKAASFAEGHYIQVETAAILEHSANQALAREFLTFLLSPKAQEILTTGNWMYPSALEQSEWPAEYQQLITPQSALMIDPELIEANKKAWVNEAINALAQ